MRKFLISVLFILHLIAFGQKKPEDFGFKHLAFEYKNTTVDIILQSKKGEEKKQKPLLLFCQGSTPQPVIKYDNDGVFQVFPFDVNDFLENYHIAIIGKPEIPVIADVKDLKRNFEWLNDSLQVPLKYSNYNYLDFYVDRNIFILKKLLKLNWIDKTKLIVAGHSEGSSVAAKMSSKYKKITHLIYASGNPYGRINSIIEEDRYNKNPDTIEYWKYVVANKDNNIYCGNDTPKNTFTFSEPFYKYLLNTKIPILVTYGEKDWSTPFNNLLYVEAIRNNIENITFIPYEGLNHNYFPLDEDGKPNYDIYKWEEVGKDWANWLNKN